MSTANPVLGMAFYSLENALELYQTDEEGHRFGAIILIDLAVECTLKAKLYQWDSADFITNRQELGFSDLMKDNRILSLLFEDERTFLTTVHNVRNYAQHRASIPDSLKTQEYMKWLCKFIQRFSNDNFSFDISSHLQNNLRIIWTRLTFDVQKLPSGLPLKEPLEENYKSVRIWLNAVRGKSGRGYISEDHRQQLLTHLRRYCKSTNMNPDQLIEYANKGYVSPNQTLLDYQKTINNSNSSLNILKNFYAAHNVEILIPYNKYKPRSIIKEITTNQIRNICDLAPLRVKSWILASSYMGLKIGKLSLLTVDDFCLSNWTKEQEVYPVRIRREVSNTYDYTTFIGRDAKEVLKEYFDKKKLSPQDHPWTHIRRSNFNLEFQNLCKKAGIYEKGKTVPRSLGKRLRRVLEESEIRGDWINYIFGLKGGKSDIIRPLDDELRVAYEKAYPKLRVYLKENETVNKTGTI